MICLLGTNAKVRPASSSFFFNEQTLIEEEGKMFHLLSTFSQLGLSSKRYLLIVGSMMKGDVEKESIESL